MNRPPFSDAPAGRIRRARAQSGLSEREQNVLRSVVQSFIDTAAPVGSKGLAKSFELSSASIRNTMKQLEEGGYLGHPHTSAGRVPTELGYRMYVDDLMDVAGLSGHEATILRDSVRRRLGDIDAIAHQTSRVIGRLTQLLGVVLTPNLTTGVLDRIEVIPLASTRILFVLAIRGGVARTVTAEVDFEIMPETLDDVVQRLNERLAGLPLEEIRRTGADRVQDLADNDRTGVVRVVLRDAPDIFRDPSSERRAAIAGAQHLIGQPEFQQPEMVRDIVELAESEDVVVHLLESPTMIDPAAPERAVVVIGRQMERRRESADGPGLAMSIVSAPYRVGDAIGSVAVIGPTRMDYARAVALVEFVAGLLGRPSVSG